MKHLMRLIIILGVSLLGEVLSALIPLPIPASVYGLVLMLLCLCTKIVPLESVRVPSVFLVEIMPVLFIPAAAGMIDRWVHVKPLLIPVTVIMVISTFVVMGVCGRVTQALLRRSEKRRESEADK